MTSPATPRYAGLDGLRAVAVLLVVVYHLFPGWVLRSGFVGVDVFFVISGFLITSLLLRERAATGRIALGRFWTRRARRLLPALALVVVASASTAWLMGGDVLVGLGRQVLGAATFSYNWVSLASGASYFSAAEPELFRNLWSLAVEEQFYLLWPALLPLLLLVRARWARVAVAAGLAAASAGWAVALLAGGADITRAYYGTDSHAFGLLIGVALAFLLAGREASASAPRRGPLTATAGVAALAALVVVAAWPDGAVLFPSIPLAASALTAIVIWAATRSGLGAALDVAPLRWIGERSYGIYLWHWPLVVLLATATTGSFVDTSIPVAVGVAALASTVALSALSYRVLEQPVRRLGLRGTVHAMARRLGSTPVRRFGVLAGIAGAVLMTAGTTAAVAAAPPVTSSEAVVQAGRDALARASAAATPAVTTPTVPPSTDAITASPTPTAGRDGKPRPPAPQTVPGDQVTAVGDSVMLASAPGLLSRMPGIQIDAAVSRSMWAGDDIVGSLAAQNALRRYVVVGLGTNGPVDDGALERVYDSLGPDRSLVLVTAFAPREWIAGVNEKLTAFAASHPRVVVADWASAIAPHPDDLAGDQIHPGEAGGAVYAETVADAIDGIASQRAEVAYRVALIQWMTARALGDADAR